MRRRKQRRIACPIRREAQNHGRVVHGLRAPEVPKQQLGDRMSLVFEYFQRKGDIVGSKQAAVVKSDSRAQQEPVGKAVLGYLNGARGEAIQGVRLIRGAHHQTRESELHSLRAVALQDEAVERIEREDILIENNARPDMREHPALRSVRIDVVEVLEVRRVFEIPERRYALPPGGLRRIGTLRE